MLMTTTQGDETLNVVKSRSSHNNFLSPSKNLANSSSKRPGNDATMRFGRNFVEQQNTSGNSSSVDPNFNGEQEKSDLEETQKNLVIFLTEQSNAATDHQQPSSMMEPTTKSQQSFNNDFSSFHSTDIMCVDLKDRYISLENNFNDYRRKTNNLLLKKDAHISRLQERLNSFVENSNADSTMHTVVAERDALRLKLEQVEFAYNQEKSHWISELENLRRKPDNESFSDHESKHHEEKEQVSQCRIHPPTINASTNTTSTTFREITKCDCDFLRKELEQCRSESSVLNLKIENLIAAHCKQTDSIRKQFADELTNKTDELNRLRDKLTTTIIEKEELLKSLEKIKLDVVPVDDNCRLSAENQLLKRELFEAKEYFESMDVESEQQLTVLANQIDEMHEILENKQRDYVVLTNELLNKNQECESLQQKLKTCEIQTARQQDVIESLRDEFDKQKDKFRETAKDRDELLIRNASLTHEVDFTKRQSQKEREDILQQLTLAGQELDEYKEKLRLQETENDTSLVLSNLTTKVSDLEESLKRKQETVDSLEQRLATVKKLLRKNLMLKSSKSEYDLNSSPNQSPVKRFRTNNNAENSENEYAKSVMTRLFPSSENDPERVARVFGSLLRLSTDEEQLVRNFLQQKTSSQYLSPVGH